MNVFVVKKEINRVGCQKNLVVTHRREEAEEISRLKNSDKLNSFVQVWCEGELVDEYMP